MAQLVVPRKNIGQFASLDFTDQQPNGDQERLVKYIPAESVSFYLISDGLISTHINIDSTSEITSLLQNYEIIFRVEEYFSLSRIVDPEAIQKSSLSGLETELTVHSAAEVARS